MWPAYDLDVRKQLEWSVWNDAENQNNFQTKRTNTHKGVEQAVSRISPSR
jgi:hypothetical protein